MAEGAIDEGMMRTLTPFTDFLGLGDEIWQADDPKAALKTLIAAMA